MTAEFELTHRLLDVHRLLKQLSAEQKAIHEPSAWTTYGGTSLHLLTRSSEGWGGMEAQLKARQLFEQTTGLARWRRGAAFWVLGGERG